MKFVKLLGSAHVNGVLRHPHEGVLHVTNEEATRLLKEELVEDVSADFEADQDEEAAVDKIAEPEAMPTHEAPSEPHQTEVAPQATKGGRRAANKE